jgi:dTDP-4-dehydrorhamnose reductase
VRGLATKLLLQTIKLMKILITGASGQLGRTLQTELNAHEIIATDSGELDITCLADVRAAISAQRPDVVINAAAYTNVDAAESDSTTAYRVNALAPRNLAIVTGLLNIPLVQVSTDYVFDGAGSLALHEYDRTNPQSVYGASKLAGEEAVRQHNLRHFIARTAWLYCHQLGGLKNFPLTMLAQAARTDISEVRVVNDQHGSPTYAPHLAHALAELINTEAYGTYHLAGQGGATWHELTVELYRRFDISLPVQAVTTDQFPRPAKRPAYSVLTTIQDPPILLPDWRAGLDEFAHAQKRLG